MIKREYEVVIFSYVNFILLMLTCIKIPSECELSLYKYDRKCRRVASSPALYIDSLVCDFSGVVTYQDEITIWWPAIQNNSIGIIIANSLSNLFEHVRVENYDIFKESVEYLGRQKLLMQK